MYQGYPDFQNIIISDGQRLVAAYQQGDDFYLYPESVTILAEEPLAFSLDIIRSYSAKSIYGKLSFTTELQFVNYKKLINFNKQHQNKAIKVLPVTPQKLRFDAPIGYHSTLTEQAYDATWYSAQSIQFIILLNSDSTLLIKKTLLDDIVGFSARLDGCVEGVSPRLGYSVEFDPNKLIAELATNVKGAKIVGNLVNFDYSILTQYLYDNITNLPVVITPQLNSNDKYGTLLFSQTFLDRLFNQFGSPSEGEVNNNTTYINLFLPSQPGRQIFNLATVELSQRPLCFLLDPFAAAQQIAKISPDKIIYETTAPPLPQGQLNIGVFYSFPQGLKDNQSIDIQITVPAADIYPFEQTQTQRLTQDKSHLTFTFNNNSVLDGGFYQYQIRVNYPKGNSYQTITGDIKNFEGNTLVLDYSCLPCKFMTFYIDSGFATESKIEGVYHSADWSQDLELTQAVPYFSSPIIGTNTYAEIIAYSLSSSGSVVLRTPITQSTTIGAYSFPVFGSQQALIKVDFSDGVLTETVTFQAQADAVTTEHTFTHQQNTFEYQWNVISIYAVGFRYKTSTRPWSEYVTGDQTIII